MQPLRRQEAIGLANGVAVKLASGFARWLEQLVQLAEANDPPAGSLQMTLATVEPVGWKFCNGQSLSKADYPDLYAVIGGTFGETATDFTLPDAANRVLIGAGDIALQATGGASSVTLATDNLPAHTHGVTDAGHTHTFTGTPHNHTVTDPGHAHSGGVTLATTGTAGADAEEPTAANTGSQTTGITIDNATAGGTNASATTGISVDSTGSGAAFDITPPAIGVNVMVKT